MVTVILARHTATDDSGLRLAGWAPTPLNDVGRRQAQRLSQRLAAYSPKAIYSSPLERTRQTAAPLSSLTHVPLCIHNGLIEIDFGRWQGQTFSELDHDPQWRLFNTAPDRVQMPGRETLAQVASRGLAAIAEIATRCGQGCAVAFSHADVIRLLLTLVLGTPVHHFRGLEVGHGSFFEFEVVRGRVVLTDREDLDIMEVPSSTPQ